MNTIALSTLTFFLGFFLSKWYFYYNNEKMYQECRRRVFDEIREAAEKLSKMPKRPNDEES